MIFDTHTHYDDKSFDEDRQKILESLNASGIEAVVDVGASIESTKAALILSKEYPFIYCAAGVHPSNSAELDEEKFIKLSELIKKNKYEKENDYKENKIVAVGEIGLDYYWKEPDKEIQKKWFKKQLELALSIDLPVIIHSRDSAMDTLNIIKDYYDKSEKRLTGVIHCFSYSLEQAKEYLNMGFYLGIGGVVTFKNAKKLKEVVHKMPLDRLVLETDCPYLSPEPLRGTRNISKNLTFVIKYISELRGIKEEELENITFENAKKLYKII